MPLNDPGCIWIAVIGPDTAPLGVRENPPPVKQAAQIAALLSTDYRAAEPKAAAPLPVFGKP